MVIHTDGGGVIAEYISDLNKAHNIVIDGPCESACTLFLSHSSVCATKNAKLMFHRPYYLAKDGTRYYDEKLDAYYLSLLPTKVRVYVEKRGLTKDGWWVYAAQVIAWVGECKPGWQDEPSNNGDCKSCLRFSKKEQ